MAYNLQTLINILNQILDPDQKRWILGRKKPKLQSLHQKVVSLQQFLEKYFLTNIESWESEIRDAAHKAEDIIESNMADRMLSNPKKAVRFTFSEAEMEQVIQKFGHVKRQVAKLIIQKRMSSGSSSSGVSFSHDVTSKSIGEDHLVQSKDVVGVDEDLTKLKDQLLGPEKKLEIVSIVGMGGIGKTTLAQKLYDDPSIVKHFSYRAWTTVSQEYDMKEIILSLLRCIIGKECDDQCMKMEVLDLKLMLHDKLYDERYMIVLDDLWSTQFWYDIRRYLPDVGTRSRIVITTRLSVVAKDVSSQSEQHEMQFLNESESWDLLRQEAFGDEEDCPTELKWIGRDIARNCGGLPLAICVIGGLLSSKGNRSEDVWEDVAKDVTAAAVGAKSVKQFSNILSLSYNHLPTHLRPCFLYMGAFPKNYEIKASKLVRLWVAEGFLKSKGEKSLEEEAEDCLKALVDRNLVSVRAVKSDGRAKSYGIHDLMRDLCLNKVEQQRFVHVGKKKIHDPVMRNQWLTKGQEEVKGIRRVSIHPSYDDIDLSYTSKSMSLARSFLCIGHTWDIILSDVLMDLRLLRVLDLLEIEFDEFPREILQILNLRYLAFSYDLCGGLPSDISRLCNLQTLVISCSIFRRSISLPREILQIAELRHLIVYRATFCFDTDDWSGLILDKLQTVFYINPSHEFLYRIPNVKKLGIRDGESIFDLSHLDKLGESIFDLRHLDKLGESIYDLSHLDKLETLRYFRHSLCRPLITRSTLILPLSLKKLSLRSYGILGEFMNYLSELPNLEVLKLTYCNFKGWEWDAREKEFNTLKFLLLESVNLVKWEADETNFPRLRHLVIRYCTDLEEIPFGIGDIATLQTIQLDGYYSRSLVASAKLIIEDQRDNGNDNLQLWL